RTGLGAGPRPGPTPEGRKRVPPPPVRQTSNETSTSTRHLGQVDIESSPWHGVGGGGDQIPGACRGGMPGFSRAGCESSWPPAPTWPPRPDAPRGELSHTFPGYRPMARGQNDQRPCILTIVTPPRHGFSPPVIRGWCPGSIEERA